MPSLRVTAGAKVSASWLGDFQGLWEGKLRTGVSRWEQLSQTITITDLYGVAAATMCHHDTA